MDYHLNIDGNSVSAVNDKKSSSAERCERALRVRAVVLDWARSKTHKGAIELRVFGPTDTSQSCCLRILGLHPYILVGPSPAIASAEFLENSLDHALNIEHQNNLNHADDAAKHPVPANEPASGAKWSRRHVHKIDQVELRRVYGYAKQTCLFWRVKFRDPLVVGRAAALLRAGVIGGAKLEVLHAHIPFVLQSMIELGIYGMDWITIPSSCLSFRRPLPESGVWSQESLAHLPEMFGSRMAAKETRCDLELDVFSDVIAQEDDEGSRGDNRMALRSLDSIWKDLGENPPQTRSQRECTVEIVQSDIANSYVQRLHQIIENSQNLHDKQQEEDSRVIESAPSLDESLAMSVASQRQNIEEDDAEFLNILCDLNSGWEIEECEGKEEDGDAKIMFDGIRDTREGEADDHSIAQECSEIMSTQSQFGLTQFVESEGAASPPRKVKKVFRRIVTQKNVNGKRGFILCLWNGSKELEQWYPEAKVKSKPKLRVFLRSFLKQQRLHEHKRKHRGQELKRTQSEIWRANNPGPMGHRQGPSDSVPSLAAQTQAEVHHNHSRVSSQCRTNEELTWQKSVHSTSGSIDFKLQSSLPSRDHVNASTTTVHRRPFFSDIAALPDELAAAQRLRFAEKEIRLGGPIGSSALLDSAPTRRFVRRAALSSDNDNIADIGADATSDQALPYFDVCLIRDPPSAEELLLEQKQSASTKGKVLVQTGHIDSGGRTVMRLEGNRGGALSTPGLSSNTTSPAKSAPKSVERSRADFPVATPSGDGLRLLSIEVLQTCRSAELQPNPKYDPVMAIAAVLEHNENIVQQTILINRAKVSFMWCPQSPAPSSPGGTCGSPLRFGLDQGEIDVIEMDSELALMGSLIDLILDADPDIILGFEVQKQSLGYLQDRCESLRESPMSLLHKVSRVLSPPEPSSRPDEWGEKKASGLHIDGRIVLNVWRLLRSELKLTQYTMPSVAAHVLRRRVPEFTAHTLEQMASRSSGGFATACLNRLERARLCLELLRETRLITRTAEMARLFGIDFFSVLSRGSQFRVESVLLRQGRRLGFAFASPSREDVRDQPAMIAIPLVMEPISALYSDPVVVLDFQSLYPSIMIAYNLCYSTCLGSMLEIENGLARGRVSLGASGQVHVNAAGLQDVIERCGLHCTPNGVFFVKSCIAEGLFPRLLRDLLNTRIAVKKALKKEKPGSVRANILNNRQFAIKMLSNVCYGYTAAGFSGRMPCAELADSIVQTARETLERAMELVTDHPTWNAQVVYGDTDSLFVSLPGRTRKDAFRIGSEIAAAVTADNPAPVRLQFEKVYHPGLLVSKKRYVGMKYESEDDIPVIDAKGIEMVRRDGCPLLVEVMERTIRLLFAKDLSRLREYMHGVFQDVLLERLPVSRFIIAKEVRLGTYRAQLPPGALLAERRQQRDPCSRPLYAERVPYVVVAGPLNSRVRDLVVEPEKFLPPVSLTSNLRINGIYYITRMLIPSLDRLVSLVGVNLHSWYQEMPQPRPPPSFFMTVPSSAGAANLLGGSIERYCIARHCLGCSGPMDSKPSSVMARAFCSKCRSDRPGLVVRLLNRQHQREKRLDQLDRLCRDCCGQHIRPVRCTSLHCPVPLERSRVTRAIQSEQQLAVDDLEW